MLLNIFKTSNKELILHVLFTQWRFEILVNNLM